jgi:hypothetical protein
MLARRHLYALNGLYSKWLWDAFHEVSMDLDLPDLFEEQQIEDCAEWRYGVLSL